MPKAAKVQEIAEKFSTQKIQFFKALVNLLPFGDWQAELLASAEKQCAFGAGYHQLLFPGGINQIIAEKSAWQDQVLLEKIAKLNIIGGTKQKIAHSIYERIILNSQISHIKYMSYFLSTANFGLGAEIAWQTCSKIWYYAGDKSVDLNYYTKRGLLLAAYASALMFYASDESTENSATKKFIENALHFITEIAALKNKFSLPEITDIPFLRLL